MTRNFILFSVVSLTALSSFATIKTVQVVDGTASAVIVTSTSSGTTGTGGTTDTTTTVNTYTILGGYTGAIGECTSPASNSSTCDSCTGTGAPTDVCTTAPYACNNHSIHPNLNLAITMSMDPLPANPQVRIEVASTTGGTGTQASTIPYDTSLTTVPSAAGGSFTVYIPWKNICSALGMGANCDGNAAVVGTGTTADINVGLYDSTSSSLASGNFQKFTIRIRYQPATENRTKTPTQSPDSTNQPGFSDFSVFPGDSKVYISDLFRGNLGPTDNSGMKWKSLRVYYEEFTGNPNYCSISPGSSGYADLDVVDKTQVATSLTQDFLKGLTNDVDYMFTIASIDESGIVSEFLDLTPPTGSETAYANQYTATPGEVVGLLNKHKCFIATAAFGSPMEPHVELLRNFRDRVLAHFSLGKKFIRFYYQNSPPVAEYIAQHDWLRTLVRGLLWPIVWFAEAALQWGVWAAFGLFAAIAGLMLVFVQRTRNRRNA